MDFFIFLVDAATNYALGVRQDPLPVGGRFTSAPWECAVLLAVDYTAVLRDQGFLRGFRYTDAPKQFAKSEGLPP
jgi:hypothetical protein